MEKKDSFDPSSLSLNEQFFIAINKNEITNIAPLIQKGVNINIQDADGNTPLHIAAHNFNEKITIHLMTYEPKLTITNNKGESAKDAIHAMQYEKDLSQCIKRYQQEIETSHKDCCDFSDVDFNPEDFHQQIIKTINHHKQLKSPSWPIEHSFSHIDHHAWREKSMIPLITLLLKNGANPDLIIKPYKYLPHFYCPLHKAAWHNLPELLKLLIPHAKTIDVLDWQGDTPLQIAVLQEKEDCVAILLEKNASINTINEKGNTPLHTAILSNQSNKITKLILQYSPDVSIKNNDGETALQLVESTKPGWIGFVYNMIPNLYYRSTIKAIKNVPSYNSKL